MPSIEIACIGLETPAPIAVQGFALESRRGLRSQRAPFPPSFLEFSSAHVGEVRAVLARIVAASPLGQVLFTTDWEFGPEWAYRFGPLTLEEFWRLHDSRTLYLNTAYALVPGRAEVG